MAERIPEASRVNAAISNNAFLLSSRGVQLGERAALVAGVQATLGLRGPTLVEVAITCTRSAQCQISQRISSSSYSSSSHDPQTETIDRQTMTERARGGSGWWGPSWRADTRTR